jgi:uncharacterized protein (DUF2147 family)
MKQLIFIFLVGLSAMVQGQDIVGQWKSVDDETGKPKSIVEIYKKGDKYYGKIIKLFREPQEDQDPICKECEDDRKDKKIIGMEIIRDMEADGDAFEEGTILDPKNGSIYDCKIWIDPKKPDVLNVRGYLYFIYRTQYWVRVK